LILEVEFLEVEFPATGAKAGGDPFLPNQVAL
jgi:hypothetical protein